MSEAVGNVLKTVRQTIARYGLLEPATTVVVAVSGGPDSLCLLDVLHSLRGEYDVRLHVAHLNHCLRGAESDSDADFVRDLATAWELPVTVSSADVPRLVRERKLSLEEAARQARYAFLATVASEVGAGRIAVAHHADDQTETVLMHWLRGAGLAGLRGMLPRSLLGELHLGAGVQASPGLVIIRPLLYACRSDIEAYCQSRGLKPRFDRSNLDTTYFRNRLRHELLPYLETYNPNIREVIRRSAEALSGDYEVIHAQVQQAWRQVGRAEAPDRIDLDLARWRDLPLGLQRSIIRMAIQKLRSHLRDIGWEHVENALWIGRERETGTQATLPDGLVLTVGYEELVVSECDTIAPKPEHPWLIEDIIDLVVPGITHLAGTGWSLNATFLEANPDQISRAQSNPDPWQAFLDADRAGCLTLRRRRMGDRFHPLGMGGKSKSLREFMINEKIPEKWRDLIPIGVSGEEIAWVAGWRLGEHFRVTPSTRRILHLAFFRQ